MAVAAHTKQVKLFYLGGLTPAGVKSAPVTASNGSYMLPEPGGYITVPEYAAKDLIRKHKITDRNGQVFDAFTTDIRVVNQYYGKAQARPVTVTDTTALSDDALLAELERRKLLSSDDPVFAELAAEDVSVDNLLEPQLEVKPKGKK